MHYIYKLTNTKTETSYIGETSKPKSRFSSHKYHIQQNKYSGNNSHFFIDDIGDSSPDDFMFEILLEFIPMSDEHVLLTEASFIDSENTLYPNGYNCKKYTVNGWIISKEYVSQYWPDFRGVNNPNFGNKWTEEMKCSMSEIATARHASGEHYGESWREQQSQINKERWRNYTPDEKDKIMSKQSLSSSKYKYLQFTKDGGFVKEWGSVREILKENPTFKRAGINSAASGYKKSYMGYIWKKELTK